MKSPFCYLAQNPTKSLCQPSDSATFSFLDFAGFWLFWAGFSDNLVTGFVFWPFPVHKCNSSYLDEALSLTAALQKRSTAAIIVFALCSPL
jgi:hypothetical protein